jgi:hypothetical protein
LVGLASGSLKRLMTYCISSTVQQSRDCDHQGGGTARLHFI